MRNDNFTVADMCEIYTGKKSATPNILSGVELRDLRNALKAEDVKRRLKEAETFIKEHQDATTSKATHNSITFKPTIECRLVADQEPGNNESKPDRNLDTTQNKQGSSAGQHTPQPPAAG